MIEDIEYNEDRLEEPEEDIDDNVSMYVIQTHQQKK